MKNIINNISTFIIFITFIFSINSVFAKLSQDTKNPKQKVTANLIFKRGDVLFRTPDTKFESIEVGQDLFEKDILKTESGAVAILVLPDSSKIKVGPSTEIKIEKLVSQIEDESFEESSIILRTGKILIDIINKSAEPVLKIKTKNAAIAVRGTRFFLSQEYSGDARAEGGRRSVDAEYASRHRARHKRLMPGGFRRPIPETRLQSAYGSGWTNGLDYG